MRPWIVTHALLATALAVSTIQEPLVSIDYALSGAGRQSVFDFSPVGSLTTLSSHDFTTLRHPLVPGYGVRIKKSNNFCDGSVNAYTGYIDIAARHLFFYFFESRRDPQKDDVIFWTNGGPECSSAMGLFMENGPCRVTGENETTFHPHSWNEVANIFYIDQPIGAGFSYAEYGEYVSTTEEAARDIGAFLFLFFEHFITFQGRALHMAGESYGGRMIPAFASYIVDQNKRLVEAGATPINLKSIILANGCSDWSTMLPSFYNVQCEHHSAPPVVDIQTCVALRRMLPRCEKRLQESCYDTKDPIECKAAWDFCSQLAYAYDATGYNPYDITKKCDGAYEDTMCYPATKNISTYLSLPTTQNTLGIDKNPNSPTNFTSCNMPARARFTEALDGLFPTWVYMEQLIERGVKVLVYVGDVDWICNWIGNERMTFKIEWKGQQEFVSTPLRPWNVTSSSHSTTPATDSNGSNDSQLESSESTYEAGLTRSLGPLTFATVHGGGHMTPYDRPLESLELVRRWLDDIEL